MLSSTNTDAAANLLTACWQNKGKILLVFAASLTASAGYLYVVEPRFTSEASLFVRLGKETVGLDPTATTGQTIAVQDSREKEIFSVQTLVQSRTVLESVVDKIGPERILEASPKAKGKSSWMPIDMKTIQSLNPVYVDSPRDKAIEALSKRLEIFNPRSTTIIGLRYETIDPALAANVLSEVIDATIDTHVRVHQNEGSSKFFELQTEELGKQVAEIEEELLYFKNTTGFSEMGQQRQLQIAQISQLESALLDATAMRETVEGEIESRKAILSQQPGEVKLTETTGLPSSATQGMREQLYALQLQEKELIARFSADHPNLKGIKEQIVAAQRTLNEEDALKQITVGLNESRREMESALLNQQAVAASLKAKQRILTEQLAAAKAELKNINENELRLAQINRKLDLSRRNYEDYAQRFEQTRIDLALSEKNLSNLSILQSPSQSKIPSNPKVMLTMFIGATIAAFLSLLISVASHVKGRVPTRHAPKRHSNVLELDLSPRESSKVEESHMQVA